ncbi:MAG: hypothetical protein U0457_03620 [Candidatus Sericytochromatia bacterium]
MIKAPIIERICPFCVSSIAEAQECVFCFDCKKPHHKECWQYNLNRCAAFGCKGNKIDTNYLKPVASPKKIEPVPIIINPPQEIVKPAVKELKLKPIKNKKYKYPKIFNKKEARIPDSVPKPEQELPDYINDPLKPEVFSFDPNKKRYIRKAFPLPVIRYPKKKEEVFETIPVPEFQIPDYVTQEVVKPEEPPPAYVPKMPEYLRLKIESIQKKKDKDKLKKYGKAPKPERYVPDYVHLKEIPKKKKKKKIPQYFKPLIMYPPMPINEDHLILESKIEKPEAYIPDYVYSEVDENDKFLKSLLPEELVKNKKCIHCHKTFTIEALICPHCKKTQSLEDYKYLNYIKPEVNEIRENDENIQYTTIFVNVVGIKFLTLHRNGYYLSFGCKDKNVKVWDLNKKQLIYDLEGHRNYVNCVDFSPDGRYFASGSVDTTIRIWGVEDGSCKREVKGNPMGFNHIKYSPDGDYIISSSGEGMIKVWERFNGLCVRMLRADLSWVNLATFSPDMEYVCSCDADNMIRIWEIMESKHIKTLVGHFDSVNTIAFSPNGRYLASGSNDNTIKIWDLKGDEPIRNLLGHFDSVNEVSFSPDGRYLVSCSNDKTVKVWDLYTLKCVRNMRGHNGSVTSVVYGHNGTYVISAGDDKTVRIWYLI